MSPELRDPPTEGQDQQTDAPSDSERLPWDGSPADRFSHLGLADHPVGGGLPPDLTVADLLAWALMAPGAVDPIDGILEGVAMELQVLAMAMPSASGSIDMMVRRIRAAIKILRWSDNRERMPVSED